MNISPSLLKVLGRDDDFASFLSGDTTKNLTVGDVHATTALGNGKKRKKKPVAFDVDSVSTVETSPDFIDPEDPEGETTIHTTKSFAEILAEANNIDIDKLDRHLKPHKDGGAHSPFPYDPQAMDKIPPEQQRRFLSALTDQDSLPQRKVPIKSLVSIQPRVSPEKIDSIRENGADKLPLVVRHDGKNYVADGTHRATASWLDGENTIDCKYCVLSGEDESIAKEVDWELEFEIRKADEDQQLIFGWASVVQEGDYLIIDKQGDMILPEELERSAYEYMIEARDHGDSHSIIGTGKCIESAVFTKEKQRALGIEIRNKAGHQVVGWWVGFKVDDATWARHKSGELKEFSIGGKSASIPIDELMKL